MTKRAQYDLVVIGGGVGGLQTAVGAARLGASVALVEKRKLGGDCLYHGCVPSKTLVRTARSSYQARSAGAFGVLTDNIRVDYARVRDRLARVIARVGQRDSAERLRGLGIDVVFGSGRFEDDRTFVVDATRLRARKFVLATGSGPKRPEIEGLDATGYETNLTIFDTIEHLPRSMVVLGGGPVGVEMAQVFQRMGCQTTLLEQHATCLRHEDPEAAECLEKCLVNDGVRLLTRHKGVKAERDENDYRLVHVTVPDGTHSVAKGEVLLVGAGRRPSTDGLGLDAAGIERDADGFIRVDRTLRTSRSHIFAVGDCIGPPMYTHVAEYEATLALPNALYGLRRRARYAAAPHCTYTEPEVAQAGLTEQQAREAGHRVQVYRHRLDTSDRQIIDGREYGFIKLVCKGRRLLGASVIGYNASDLLHEFVVVMTHKLPITTISRTMHLYPSLGLAARRAADGYYKRTLLKSRLVPAAKWLFRLRGEVKTDDV
jgi:pyruvate/2-oxoglutarate dehydrogenase complex dihydrolipoamide dehydrogenase (E3) component